jgi:nucleotide-binding universal stress UspA family protein
MPTTHPVAVTFEHILVPTDFSDVSGRALEYAKTLAKQGTSELLLAHVSPGSNLITTPEAAWIDAAEIEGLEEQELEQRGAALRSEGYRARTISLTGPLCDQLLSAIKEYKVDLIVLGTHGRKGLERLLLGSDAEALLRHAHCPVISIGPGVEENKTWHLREVICATTLEPHSAEVVAYAQKLALQHGAGLIPAPREGCGERDKRGLGIVRRCLSLLCSGKPRQIFVAAHTPQQCGSGNQHC